MRLAALIILAILPHLAFAESPDDGAIAWRLRYDNAYQEMQTEKRPMLIFIKSDACLFCKRMEVKTYQDPVLAKQVNDGFVPAMVNSTKTPDLAKQFRPRVFPTTVIVASDGRVIDMIPGYVTADKLQVRLSAAQTKLR